MEARAAAAIVLCFGQVGLAQCVREWLPLGTGLDNPGLTSLVWDPDGPGPQRPLLVVSTYSRTNCSNQYQNLPAWDGHTWCSLGEAPYAYALALHNGQLIAGGFFTTAGGQPANNVARWDGAAWHPLGQGVGRDVLALTSYNGELTAAGTFDAAGGQPASRIARWDGFTWRPLGTGIDGYAVTSLAVYNGDLIAAGYFTSAGGQPANNIARWDSGAWHPIASGLGFNDSVRAITVYNGELLAMGGIYTVQQVPDTWIARWNGSNWSDLGPHLTFDPDCFAVFNGDLLVAGHTFNFGGSDYALVRWSGAQWLPFADGRRATDLAVYDGDLIANGVTRWGCRCYANCDTAATIPALNVNDFICFQQAYARGDPYANCDNSTAPPVLNIADSVCFMSRFAAGCQ